MKTLTDVQGNILQPTDRISIKTAKGVVKGDIISMNEDKIRVKINGKIKVLDYKKFRDSLLLESINHAYVDGDRDIRPMLTEVLTETYDHEDTYNPELELNEMYSMGIRTNHIFGEEAKLGYYKEQIATLVNSAKALTREHDDLQYLTEAFNRILNTLNDTE